MNNIRIRKRKSAKEILKSVVTGDFWFPDDKLNVATKKIIGADGKVKTKIDQIAESVNKNSIIVPTENKIENRIENNSIEFREVVVESAVDPDSAPIGYIRLFLNGIDVNTLFLKHNITLKYITLGDKMYIKSFILGNDGKEIDCYNIGENESLTIIRENNSIVKIILKEISGNHDEITIVNGAILG